MRAHTHMCIMQRGVLAVLFCLARHGGGKKSIYVHVCLHRQMIRRGQLAGAPSYRAQRLRDFPFRLMGGRETAFVFVYCAIGQLGSLPFLFSRFFALVDGIVRHTRVYIYNASNCSIMESENFARGVYYLWDSLAAVGILIEEKSACRSGVKIFFILHSLSVVRYIALD